MRMIFMNLPVSDLDRSRAFFTGLGFSFNPEFSDDSAACMVVDDNIFVMLLVQDRFREFITGDIADAATTTEVLPCLSADSREQADEMVGKAVALGGKPWLPPMEDGGMYGVSFQDLDGHVWELMSMAGATRPAEPVGAGQRR